MFCFIVVLNINYLNRIDINYVYYLKSNKYLDKIFKSNISMFRKLNINYVSKVELVDYSYQ